MFEEDEEVMRQLELLQKLSVNPTEDGGTVGRKKKARKRTSDASSGAKSAPTHKTDGPDQGDSGGEPSVEEEGDTESRWQFEQLYDPHADSDDEKWVRDNFTSTSTPNNTHQLTCPCCFTLLCAEAQAHEKYTNQFRAVRVLNCTVRNTASTDTIRINDSNNDGLRTVVCTECETEVAVRDEKDGFYIFCNVLY